MQQSGTESWHKSQENLIKKEKLFLPITAAENYFTINTFPTGWLLKLKDYVMK